MGQPDGPERMLGRRRALLLASFTLTPMNAQPASDPTRRLESGKFRPAPVSFVRRNGRLAPRHQRALEQYGDKYVLDLPRGEAFTSVHPDYALDVEAVYGRNAPLIVEIGSGQGEAVLVAAGAQPDVDFLALEVYPPGIARTVLHAGARGLTNLRVAEVNAPDALASMLAPESVSEVWVFFPDPWHKLKHVKRRLVVPGFTELVARVLEPGGTWRLATDWLPYAEQIKQVLAASSDFEPLEAGTDGIVDRFEGRALTGFEKKAHAAGRTITDFAFRKIS